MVTITELQAQKERFKQAYDRGEITKQQYVEATIYTQNQINQLKTQSQQAEKTVAPLPSQFGSQGPVTYTNIGNLTPTPSKQEPSPSRGTIPSPPKTAEADLTKVFTGPNVADKTLTGISETTKMQKDPYGYVLEKGVEIGGTLAILTNPVTAIPGATISTGITQGVVGVTQGRFLTPEEVKQSATFGALISVGAEKVTKEATKKAPVLAETSIRGTASRAALSAGIGAGASGVVSKGDLGEIAKGALIGAGISIGVEAGYKGYQGLKAHLPERWGGVERLTSGELTTGKSGEPVETYVSKPNPKLDNKQIRVIADVTENPVGTGGVTTASMIDDYVGRNIPTAHATLKPENFSLSVGGKTVLQGFPEESAGFRSSQQLYHFYSAPGSEEFVNVYGGYAGVGVSYSDDVVKVVFGGKSTALVTTDTKVSSEFLRSSGESIDDYLARTSKLSGKTGIAQETVLGKSAERQLITPAQYERFGEPLQGSMFVSEGKVGAYQIKKLPTGILGKIPVVKDFFSEYTNINVYKGTYAPATNVAGKVLNVPSYSSSYGKILSLPKTTLYSPTISSTLSTVKVSSKTPISPAKVIQPSIPKISSGSKGSSNSINSIVSTVTKSTGISSRGRSFSGTFPTPNFSFSTKSTGSKPSTPSFPSPPSIPDFPKYPEPSPPSKPSPSSPSYPNPSPPYSPPPYSPPSNPKFPISSSFKVAAPFPFPRGGGDTKTQSPDKLFGRWNPRTHKVKPWDRMLKTFGFGGAVGKVPAGVKRISRMETPRRSSRKKRRVKRKR